MLWAKQSTAKTIMAGPILDSAGVAVTGEVVASIKIAKNGTVGSLNGSATLTHDHTGNYKLALTASDTDTLGAIELSLDSGTNAMQSVKLMCLPSSVFDAFVTYSAGNQSGLLLSLSNNQVNVGQWLNSVVMTPTTTGVPEVNTRTITPGALNTEIQSIKTVTDKLSSGIIPVGATYQYSAQFLELAPVGSGGAGGSGDWTATEKGQIRYRLGLDGSVATPSATPSLALQSTSDTILTSLIAVSGYVDTEVSSIKVKTDFLPSATAGAAGGLFIAGSNAATSAVSLTTNLLGTVNGVVSGVTIASGTLTSGVFAANAINSYVIANDAIGSGQVAATAVTKIQSGLATPTNITYATGIVLAPVTHTGAVIPTTTNLTNLPTMPSGWMTGSGIAATAISAIQSGVALQSTLVTVSGYVDTEIAAIKAKTDQLVFSTANQLDVSILSVTQAGFSGVFQTYSLPESYATNGSDMTPAQAFWLIQQGFLEFSIVGTGIYVKKKDRSTTAATYYIDNSGSPTSRTRFS